MNKDVCFNNDVRLEKIKSFKAFQLMGEDWQFNKFQGEYTWSFEGKAHDGNGQPCDLIIHVEPDEKMIESLLSVRGRHEEFEGIGINKLDKKIIITEIIERQPTWTTAELVAKMREYAE